MRENTNLASESDSAKNKPLTERTYADLIVDYLYQIGAHYVFGIPGGAIEPFYNALARHEREFSENVADATEQNSTFSTIGSYGRKKVRPVIARHETGAASMADGYTRETGHIGVCCGTTGPGTTNLITGVAGAYADEVPMLVITPQTALPSFGRSGLQESSADAIDTVNMFEDCTRYNSLVSHPDQLESKLVSALVAAFRMPRGPVHISVPMDILNSPVSSSGPSYNVIDMLRQPVMTEERSLDALCEKVINVLEGKNEKIVVFIGHGCGSAVEEVVEFAELVGAEFVTTPTGKRWINSRHPLYRGVFGFAGHESAHGVLQNEQVALILAAGTDLGELSTNGWDENALLNNKLIHIEESMQGFEHSPMAGLHVYGHLQTVFETLTSVVKRTPSLQHSLPPRINHDSLPVWPGLIPPGVEVVNPDSCSSSASPIKPQRLICELVNRLPSSTRYVVDAGNAWCWSTHYLHAKEAGTYRIAMGFGAMGWAIGAAVGTAMGVKGGHVVCLTGDGSFLMSGQEITVALMEKLPVIYVVLNDQALGMVKHGQRLGKAERIGYELPDINYALMAKAMGIDGYRVACVEDLAALDFDKILSSDGPTLLDIQIDPEEVPPMGARVKVLESAR